MTGEGQLLHGRTLAVFDFDGTLAAKDSLWPFLVKAAGLPRCLWAALGAGLELLLHPAEADKRTLFKTVLVRRVLRGRKLEALRPAIEQMRDWPRWLMTVEDVKRHHAAGDHVLIATGSLDLYIREMLGSLPYDGILATEIGVENGVLTGEMPLGNCVRQRKAERVAAYIEQYGPFADSWAYGNAPHDFPMMELTAHRVVV